MSFNAEFVKNRSFEIAWAIFRCAALMKNSHIKNEIEKAAVNLVAEFGGFEPQKDFKKGKIVIDSLNNLIRLAEAVGELNSINSLVLFRESDNLFNAVQSLALDLARKEEEKELKATEGIFSVNSAIIREKTEEEKEFGNDSTEFTNDGLTEFIARGLAKERATNNSAKQDIDFSAINKEENKLPNIILAKAPERKFLTVNKENNSPTIQQNSKDFAEQKNLAKFTTVIRQQEDEKFEIDSWQDLLYRKIKEIRQVTTKELASFFPQISERTVRFYLQKLVESNLVSKKGSTGPGIYYTA